MVLTAAVGLIAMVHAAAALANPDPVELAVINRETGEPLKIWRHHGRLFVAGDLGGRYSLRVTNHTDKRIMVVLSVDGVNILTGQTANYDQDGYVFSPYQSYDLLGWRKSNTEVADFTFAPLPQSYAAKTGRSSDVGVIGMAVFNEKVAVQPAAAATTPPLPPPPVSNPAPRTTGSQAALRAQAPPPPPISLPAPALRLPPIRNPQPEAVGPPAPVPPSPPAPPAPPAAAAAPSRLTAIPNRLAERAAPRPLDEKLGTAHGAREWSVTYNVTFVRATLNPQAVRQIEYDTFDHLVASGVIPWNLDHRPQPFPAKPGGNGYVPDPPGER
jgi:hypothetical protein